MVAKNVYASGHGIVGKNSWSVNDSIVDALEKAFYLSFDLVEPTGKKYFYAIDVSGSMGWSNPAAHMSCTQIAAILAMAHARTEQNTFIGGFGTNFYELQFKKSDSLENVVRIMKDVNFGSTNPSSAFDYAKRHRMKPDCFIFITDNDINAGTQPSESLKRFNRDSKANAKMVVCSLVSNNASVCDPIDPNSLDISGFSTDITSVIKNFVS
jgi:60 kDa SS-A/Ro ribonucleoprotein